MLDVCLLVYIADNRYFVTSCDECSGAMHEKMRLKKKKKKKRET
jgi:hypothetical protein